MTGITPGKLHITYHRMGPLIDIHRNLSLTAYSKRTYRPQAYTAPKQHTFVGPCVAESSLKVVQKRLFLRAPYLLSHLTHC